MEYENPDLPEGINTSKEHPLKELAVLLGGVTAFCIICLSLLIYFAHLLAPLIPFETERALAARFIDTSDREQPINQYLQSLADRLVVHGELDEEIKITVHYLEQSEVNAYATLGGHIFFYRGLLEQVEDENTLATVMAHEIAHVKHRHPIKQVGRTIIIGIALTTISSSVGNGVIDSTLGQASLLTSLKYSREHEIESDESALKMLNALYGHVDGADRLFITLKEAHNDSGQPPAFFNTHPDIDQRINNIDDYALAQSFPTQGEATPLPDNFQEWLTSK